MYSFLWVRLALESLQSSAKDSKDIESRASALKNTTISLATFYDQYMAVIASEESVIASIAEKTLYWFVFALEPLRARDIAFAISMGLNEADEKLVQPVDGAKLAQCCKGLVMFREEPDNLALVHQSAQEFLCQKLDLLAGSDNYGAPRRVVRGDFDRRVSDDWRGRAVRIRQATISHSRLSSALVGSAHRTVY